MRKKHVQQFACSCAQRITRQHFLHLNVLWFFFCFFDERKHNFFPIFAQCNAHEYIMFACMIFKISQQSKLALEEKPKKLQVFKICLSSRAGIFLSFEVHLKRKISLLMQRKNRSFLFHSLSVLLHFVSFKCFTNVFNCQNLLKSILKSRSSIIPMSILENFIFFRFSQISATQKRRDGAAAWPYVFLLLVCMSNWWPFFAICSCSMSINHWLIFVAIVFFAGQFSIFCLHLQFFLMFLSRLKLFYV